MGNTALHLSVQFKQPAVEALLITRGANPAIMNKKNLTFDEVDPIRRDAAWRKRYPLILLREKLKQAESAATSSAAL
jgi:ankyrin repeat protein